MGENLTEPDWKKWFESHGGGYLYPKIFAEDFSPVSIDEIFENFYARAKHQLASESALVLFPKEPE